MGGAITEVYDQIQFPISWLILLTAKAIDTQSVESWNWTELANFANTVQDLLVVSTKAVQEFQVTNQRPVPYWRSSPVSPGLTCGVRQ